MHRKLYRNVLLVGLPHSGPRLGSSQTCLCLAIGLCYPVFCVQCRGGSEAVAAVVAGLHRPQLRSTTEKLTDLLSDSLAAPRSSQTAAAAALQKLSNCAADFQDSCQSSSPVYSTTTAAFLLAIDVEACNLDTYDIVFYLYFV